MANSTLDTLITFFKSLGFKKNNKVWYSKCDHSMILFEYQSSRFSDDFYLNLGVYYKGINQQEQKVPKSYDWHITGRHNDLLANYSTSILSNDMTDKELILLVKEIESEIIPYLKKLADPKVAARILKDGLGLIVQNIRSNDLIKYLESIEGS